MSGGHFDYKQSYIETIADDVEFLIKSNKDTTVNEWGQTVGNMYSKKTIDEFKVGLKLLRKAFIYAERIDKLVSGDDGEDNFHSRLKEDLDALSLENLSLDNFLKKHVPSVVTLGKEVLGLIITEEKAIHFLKNNHNFFSKLIDYGMYDSEVRGYFADAWAYCFDAKQNYPTYGEDASSKEDFFKKFDEEAKNQGLRQ